MRHRRLKHSKSDRELIAAVEKSGDEKLLSHIIREADKNALRRAEARQDARRRRRARRRPVVIDLRHHRAVVHYLKHIKNRYLRRLLATGKLTCSDKQKNGLVRLRLDEQKCIEQGGLEQWNAGRKILKRLAACSPKSPSNLPFSFYCRRRQEKRDIAAALAAFGHVPYEHLRFETVLHGVFVVGSGNKLLVAILDAIDRERRRQRNHLAKWRKQDPRYNELCAYRRYEVEYFRGEDLKAAYALYDQGQLEDDGMEDGEMLPEEEEPKSDKKLKRASARKIKSLIALGWKPGSWEDVVLLHSHALVHVPCPDDYETRQRTLYPAFRQYDLRRTRSTNTRAENIRGCIVYMLKCSARCAVIYTGERKQHFLNGVALLRFVRLFSKLGFRGTQGHINFSPNPLGSSK